MTTLPDRPHSALLVVEVQNGVVGGARALDGVVTTITGQVERARAEQVPVVRVQHDDEELVHGSEDWQVAPELAPADGEPRAEEHHGDSSQDTDLEQVLAGLGVGRVVVTGAGTDACVRATLHGALVRGYDTVLVGDAHTAGDESQWGAPPVEQVIAHTDLYWGSAPGRTAGTVAADVDLRATATA